VRGFLFALDLVFDIDELALDEGVVFGELRSLQSVVRASSWRPLRMSQRGVSGTVHERANSRLGRC
jgi:hypothetical protein